MANKASSVPVEKGQTYAIDITGLGHSGEGVGRYQDFTIFIPGALPGETVMAVITTIKKTYAIGRLATVQIPSPHRIVPECGIYSQCGGCQLQHLNYEEQLNSKRQQVVDAITRIAKLPEVLVHPTLGAASPWYYRNKMQFPVGRKNGKVVVGCYSQGSHDIVNTENCLIQHQINNDIVREVRKAIQELGIEPYDERTGQGVIRHVLGRVGTATGQVMVVLVTATEQLPQRQALIKCLQTRIAGLVSIVQNINSKRTNIIMGHKTRTLWGQDTITDKLGEFSFAISARSFFQVNTVQAEVLYNQAVKYAGLTGTETVIDAYCGTGTITLFLARQAAKVYGIEIVEPAILDARQNAGNNKVANVEFIVGDAVAVMPRMFQQGIKPDVIVVDPPRAGCEQKVLETFVSMEPKRIVYVSCNPASLARDLAVLNDLGYKAQEIQPVDMFAQTSHIESVVLLQRRKTAR
ncbi:23S rRNA (uracil-C(5))-methyltransferase RlmCD [Sporomusa ovata DSM 2662]|uniref:RNA methyltransferase, TrmA family n=1 Tax=Sporomusa ovata TaxID=2378 RepID=A0A0U1L7K9_9FIRM|nr:23S rRNA (uracil(1939)-C(5))-methyltransferase RlmD [Sporomusa ovata]EQB24777.1 23S rRNA (uracil-5-)-methyltransferase RumA [Sporomusa ovata DSM 2662]CQR75123.1 RNA methyltransferase, TrmA family [Sporomusa ovata]